MSLPMFTVGRYHHPAEVGQDQEIMTVLTISAELSGEPIRWRRSFVIADSPLIEGFCVLQGRSAEAVARFETNCRIPYTEVREVHEALGPRSGRGPDIVGDGETLYLVEREAFAWSLDELVASNRALVSPGVSWLRSYLDSERGTGKCIFAATSEADLRAALAPVPGLVRRIAAVTSDHPANWADTFERMWLPRPSEAEEEGADTTALAPPR